jgi:hypothetical protein
VTKPAQLSLSNAHLFVVQAMRDTALLDFLSDRVQASLIRAIADKIADFTVDEDPDYLYVRALQAVTAHPLSGLLLKRWQENVALAVYTQIMAHWTPLIVANHK